MRASSKKFRLCAKIRALILTGAKPVYDEDYDWVTFSVDEEHIKDISVLYSKGER